MSDIHITKPRIDVAEPILQIRTDPEAQVQAHIRITDDELKAMQELKVEAKKFERSIKLRKKHVP